MATFYAFFNQNLLKLCLSEGNARLRTFIPIGKCLWRGLYFKISPWTLLRGFEIIPKIVNKLTLTEPKSELSIAFFCRIV